MMFRLIAVLAVLWLTAANAAAKTELLMLEQPGCSWCARWDREIAPIYAKTDEGKQAPLRRVDITEPWPEDLKHIRIERFTPTFVLLDDGVEIDRLRGYPGDMYFWPELAAMLKKLP